ncbi:MAG: FixG Ig-like domain-containing protein [Arhodomonas sp.]|nr:FixG Ig-like domain-containing protein [Arhodomonas sp.]
MPDRNVLYRELDEGFVENVYTLRVMNMGQEPRTYTVEAAGITGLVVETDPERFTVAAGEQRSIPTRLRAEAEDVRGAGQDVTITVNAVDDSVSTSQTTRFHGPVPGR